MASQYLLKYFFLNKYENEAFISHKFYKTLHAYISMLLRLKSSHSILKQVKWIRGRSLGIKKIWQLMDSIP